MDYGHEQTKKMLERLEKDLGKLYGTAAAEVGEKFEKHMRDIAPKNRAKQVQLRIGKISEEEYNKWLLGQIAIGKRWNEMKQTLSQDFSNVHEIAAQMIGDSNMEVYALNHNYGTYEAEHGSGVNTSYTLYDKHTVERLVKENPDILPTPLKSDPRWDKQKFQEGIAQGITQGESIPKIAKRVVLGTMEKDMAKAVRNARTATTSAQNGGRLNSYKRAADMGIKLKKTWMATDDSFTRQSHIDVDGETVNINESFSNDCDYPGDPGGPPAEVWNCRCTMIADVEKASPSDKLPEGSFFDKPLTKERYDEWVREHKQEEKDHKSKGDSDDSGVVQGKDISGTWKRRSDEFDFEIEDVINAQGFDGLPKVVPSDEFERYVKDSDFLAQRTYSAPDKETLEAYRDHLYNGKWYVDCSVGGSAHGKGMYCAANYNGKLTDEIRQEMRDYIRQNKEYTEANAPHFIETFTIDPSAKFLEIPKGTDEEDYVYGLYIDNIFTKYGKEIGKEDKVRTIVDLTMSKGEAYNDYLNGKMKSDELFAINDKVNEKIKKIRDEDKDVDEIYYRAVKDAEKVRDIGSMAALMGYDGIHTHYGTCGNDTIILNRTKVIFKGE